MHVNSDQYKSENTKKKSTKKLFILLR